MNIQARATLPLAEQNRRREAVDRAFWHNRMEGLGKPGAEETALAELWITGEITREEYQKLVRDYVMAEINKRGH